MGYSDLVLEDLGPDHPLHKHMEEIRHAAERAAGLLIAKNEVPALTAFQPHHPSPHFLNLLQYLVGITQRTLSRKIVQEQFALTDDGRQEAVKFMRHATGKFAYRFHFLRLEQSGFNELFFGHVGEDHHRTKGGAIFVFDRCAGVFNGKTGSVLSPKHLICYVPNDPVLQGRVNRTFRHRVNGAVGVRMMHGEMRWL
jgi:hypothetical protein